MTLSWSVTGEQPVEANLEESGDGGETWVGYSDPAWGDVPFVVVDALLFRVQGRDGTGNIITTESNYVQVT